MKMKLWTVCVAMISTSLLAQQDSNPPPAAPIETPAPAAPATAAQAAEAQPTTAATNAPAPKPEKSPAKKPAKHAKAAELKTVPLVPGPAVVTAHRVNVRGKAGLKGEVVARLTNGEPVTVVEEIKLAHSGPEEPSAWAKILLPSAAHTWVKS